MKTRKVPAIVYILLIGSIVRLISINQSFWLDEATSGLVVRNFDFMGILRDFAPADFHPPLYYLVLKGWSVIWGTGEIALRSLSVLFGLGTIYLVYEIGREVKDRSLGNLAALLMAVAPLHVYYSQEARMYSMGAFLVSVSVYLFLKVIKKKVSLWEWAGFGVSLLVMFLTDYLLVLMVPLFWGLAFLLGKEREWWRKFGAWHIPLLAGVVFWLPVFRQQLIGGIGIKGSNWWGALGALSIKNVALVPMKFMIGRIGFESQIIYGLIVLLIFFFYGYLLVKTRRKMGKLTVIWAWLVVPLVLGMGISAFVPVLSYFRFLFVLPAMYLLLAAGLLKLDEKWFLPALMVGLIGNGALSGIYLHDTQYHREDWRELVEYISTESKENSRVVFVADSQMEGYRYYDVDRDLYFGIEGVREGQGEIWLMRYVWDIFDPSDEVRMSVEKLDYERLSEHNFGGVVVWRYENANRD